MLWSKAVVVFINLGYAWEIRLISYDGFLKVYSWFNTSCSVDNNSDSSIAFFKKKKKKVMVGHLWK